MTRFLFHLRARPRLVTATLCGIAVALLLPAVLGAATRGLLGWNLAVWLYLALIGSMMLRADHEDIRRVALVQAEAAVTVLTVVTLAVVISLVAVVAQLTAAKVPGASHALPHVLFALVTVAGSWLLLPTMFALNYASLCYRTVHGRGLNFPSIDADFKPNYVDFLYFSFTIAVASQTADVSISSQPMRRLVLVQSVLSFAFNTAVLALTINIAASLF